MQYLRQFFSLLLAPLRLLVTAPQKLLLTPRKLMGLSLPVRITAWVALVLFLFLIAALVNAFFSVNLYRPAYFGKLLLALPLCLVILFITYLVAKFFCEGEISAFEDIDRAWKAGMTELERTGLDIAQIPLFLVVGSANEIQERAMFDASRLSLTIGQVPPGPAALHWYANPDGIYLVLSNVGCLSRLASQGESTAEEVAARPVSRSKGASDPRVTMVPGDEPSVRQSITTSQPLSSLGGRPMDIRGTMALGGGPDPSESAVPVGPTLQASKSSITLPRDEWETQPERLRYVCQLVRRARQRLCPINGILTMLPYRVIQWGPREGAEVQKAVRSDLAAITSGMKLRSPVTAMVVGLEQEGGFSELVRRVGRDRARAQRFGKGFGVWDSATPEQLGALCVHACGAFEDWVYTLFREKDALNKVGNTKLYALLCKIRRKLQSRLDGILVGGYAWEGEQSQERHNILFGGCYFAATGETEDKQAFVKSVFEKLVEQQEELEWTEDAMVEDHRYRRLAFGVMVVDVILVAGLAFLAYKQFG